MTAVAQQQQSTRSLERVEVTGSRIKRVDTETPAPVQVINREQIERSGATTVTDLLKTLPANNVGAFDENAVASFSPGAGGASVRGLGAQATLILINGRRVAPYGFANGGQQTFVDVNSIPVDAVERIDVLLDGASAIYGSDAMGGVINIILRKDFQGFQARASYGISSERDGNSPKVGFTFGKGSLATDKYNIFLHVDTTQRDSVRASDRDMTRNADFRRNGLTDLRSSYSNPGNLYEIGDPNTQPAGGAFLGPVAGCSTVSSDPSAPALAGRCIYDATQYQDIQGETKRHNLLLAGTLELSGDTQLFGDLMLTRSDLTQSSPSYSTSTYYSNDTLPFAYIPLSATHAQNPYGRDVALRYRFNDVPRTTEVQSDTQRLTFGGRTSLAGWDAESALVYSRSKTKVAYTGMIRDSVLLNEVLDPNTGYARDDFIFGSPGSNDSGLMARLYPTLREQGTTSTSSFDLRGSREFGNLPGGPVGVAVGLDFRRETFKSIPDPLAEAGEISVLGTSSADGKRNVSAAFVEFSLPVLKSVETQLALRMDRYSDFGTATTPKVGVKWKALSNLAFRGTYAEGFRAPSLVETSGSPVTGFYSGIVDPVLCVPPNTDPATNDNCNLSVRNVSGANANLKPEESKSYTLGLVFEPVDDVTLSVDWYRIKRTNEIASLDPDYLLAHESQFPGYVQRDPATNEIVQLNTLLTNLGSTTVRGHDVDLRAKLSVGEYGKVSPFVTYNKMPRYKVRPTADAEEVDYAGTWLQPVERMRFGAVWETGPWTASITWNHVGSYSRAFSPSDAPCVYNGTAAADVCHIKPWNTADVFVGYKGFKNMEIGLNVQNIDNQEAPFDERMVTRYTAYRSSYHNQMGRYFTLGVKYTFW